MFSVMAKEKSRYLLSKYSFPILRKLFLIISVLVCVMYLEGFPKRKFPFNVNSLIAERFFYTFARKKI
jgi:hypothetical protein